MCGKLVKKCFIKFSHIYKTVVKLNIYIMEFTGNLLTHVWKMGIKSFDKVVLYL